MVITGVIVLLAAGTATLTVKEMKKHKTYSVEFKKVLVVVRDEEASPLKGQQFCLLDSGLKGFMGLMPMAGIINCLAHQKKPSLTVTVKLM